MKKTTVTFTEEDCRILEEIRELTGLQKDVHVIRTALRTLLRRVKAPHHEKPQQQG